MRLTERRDVVALKRQMRPAKPSLQRPTLSHAQQFLSRFEQVRLRRQERKQASESPEKQEPTERSTKYEN